MFLIKGCLIIVKYDWRSFLFFLRFLFRTFTLFVDANSLPTPVSNVGKQSYIFMFEKFLCFSLLLLIF